MLYDRTAKKADGAGRRTPPYSTRADVPVAKWQNLPCSYCRCVLAADMLELDVNHSLARAQFARSPDSLLHLPAWANILLLLHFGGESAAHQPIDLAGAVGLMC